MRPQPPDTATHNEPARPVLPISEEEEGITLVRLAVKWSSSRKLTLALCHADLAASFERHSAWQGSGCKLQPTEAEYILQMVEGHWRSNGTFRDSQSDLSQAVKVWMTGIRDVEELERVRAETDRKSNLDDEEGKGDFYANAAGESERNLALLESDSFGDDEVDLTSDEDGEIAENNGGPLRVLRPDERCGEQDNDEEYDSYDDDSYESDGSDDARDRSHTLMLSLLALLVTQS
jgi:hypothetical protein